MKLTKKIKIKGQIKAETGLHIGGSENSLDIGGVDNNVIKTMNGIPYIPGSSIKGKLRSLLAKSYGSVAIKKQELPEDKQDVQTDENFPILRKLFGTTEDEKNREYEFEPTRLIVRDSFISETQDEAVKEYLENGIYTEEKTENVINRLKGGAEHPRDVERVLKDTCFSLNMVLDVYEGDDDLINELKNAMSLLEQDYLGGNGTRGYGQIAFQNLTKQEMEIKNGQFQPSAEVEDFSLH